jgi:2'-5' RNA ligase
LSSRSLYDSIYDKFILDIGSGNVGIDRYLTGDMPDARMGVSLIIPIRSISHPYEDLVSSLGKIEPGQYCYPARDLHITIFDFIHGTETYTRDPELERAFARISRESLKGVHAFPVAFKGIVFSNAAGLIQGYDDNLLIEIRNKIRLSLVASGIRNDERYASESAHITFMRFAGKLAKAKELCGFINENRDTDLGMETIREIELVEHDWYNHESTKRIIERFSL